MTERRKRILVTRPRTDSDALATALEEAGHKVLIEPLTEIIPLATAIPALDRYDALIFTSANGVKTFAALSQCRNLPSYAVGQHTASALRADGFPDVRSGDADATRLAGLIAGEQRPGARLLHISGKDIAHDLGALLGSTTIRIDRVALYEAVVAAALSKRLVDALYACTIDIVLLFSARTAEVLATLVREAGLVDSCRKIDALCLSPRVAAAASALPWRKIAAPEQPTTEALLAILSGD